MSNPLSFSHILHLSTTSTPFQSNPNLSIPSFNTLSSKTLQKPLKIQSLQTPNPNSAFLTHPSLSKDENIKMPTAPWMQGPLLLPPSDVLDLSKDKQKRGLKKNERNERADRALTEKVSGRRGKKVMRRVVQNIARLEKFRNLDEPQTVKVKGLHNVEVEFKVPLEEVCGDGGSRVGMKMPWAKAESIVFRRMKKEKVKTAAEEQLSEVVLERLRRDAEKMTKWVKVKKVGVTQAAVDEIKMTWKSSELAMVKFFLPLSRNMDRAREILETKTGGLVVWSNKDSLVVYRGEGYKFKKDQKLCSGHTSFGEAKPLGSKYVNLEGDTTISACLDERLELPPVSGTLYEREADRLLDDLGPRFVDWWYPKPLPVDADMLPEVVSGFKTPFRRCPPHIRPKLADEELTHLRKLARYLPTHFALGRNTKLQGLATAIMKLWEKCLIVKIAVKWGIPNTNSGQMAWEIERLTGGVLILRNKFYIIFYRGKDFLPLEVANLVVDREAQLSRCQLQEEGARLKAIESFSLSDETDLTTSSIGTLSEFQDIQTKYGLLHEVKSEISIKIEAEKENLDREIRVQEHKLKLLKRKIQRSERELSEIDSAWKMSEKDVDQELITEEERNCLLKMGLKMNKTLVLGRRGVFDGVIGSMHQHWKHKEVVKVITMQRSFSQIMNAATMLEIESGGILVAIKKLQRGHALIFYRGKNYKRPLKLVPDNLLTKRAALQRSLLMQKIGSLRFFAYQRQHSISDLKIKLSACQEKSEN